MHYFKKTRKYLFCATLSIIITSFMLFPVQASDINFSKIVPNSNAEYITPKASETVWYYRTNNGKKERRLWSITEGKWLTNWMPA